jgi:hypothetical protein
MMNFTAWVDASSYRDSKVLKTAVGYVYKDRDRPPILNSKIYNGIYNSSGEIKAGIDFIKDINSYCRSMNVKTEGCTVNLKTDFDYIKSLLGFDSPVFDNPRKQELYDTLIDQISMFGKIDCELIEGKTNIAHEICYSKLMGLDFVPGKKFMEIFRDPSKSIPKAAQAINSKGSNKIHDTSGQILLARH